MIERTAKWVRRRDKYHEWWECSSCQKLLTTPRFKQNELTDYCPFCGCKMIKENAERKDDESVDS